MENNLWLVDQKTGNLINPYQIHEESNRIKPAQSFTVSLNSVVVNENFESFLRGKNDIMILSKSSLGGDPAVERVHFFEKEIPVGQPISNLFSGNIYIADDYSGIDTLWFEINVLEIDKDTGERESTVNAFQSLAGTAGAVFPAIIPYTFAASSLAKVITGLISALEKNDNIIKHSIRYYPPNNSQRRGKAPLQAGQYVLFRTPLDASGAVLENNGLIKFKETTATDSYAVFDITPSININPAFIINQKIATLMTQINSAKNGNALESTMKFLNETLVDYSNFRKLERYIDLNEKPVSDLTDEEKELMEKIKTVDDLKPFLRSI